MVAIRDHRLDEVFACRCLFCGRARDVGLPPLGTGRGQTSTGHPPHPSTDQSGCSTPYSGAGVDEVKRGSAGDPEDDHILQGNMLAGHDVRGKRHRERSNDKEAGEQPMDGARERLIFR